MPRGFRRTVQAIASTFVLAAAFGAQADAAAPELVTTGPAEGVSNYAAHFRTVINTVDGDEVVFSTRASLLPQDTDEALDVYTRLGGVTTLLTPGTAEDVNVVDASSYEESFVFLTTESLVAGDVDGGGLDLYLRTPGQTYAVSVSGAQDQSSVVPQYGGASGNLSRIAFQSSAALLANDADTLEDVYAFSTISKKLSLTSASPVAAHITYAGMSATGVVAVETKGKLLAADTDTNLDVYTDNNGALSLRSTFAGALKDSLTAEFAAFVPNSDEVLFKTKAAMVAADTDTAEDIYASTEGKLVSTGASGAADISLVATRTADSVVVRTTAKLSAADTDGADDLYLYAGGGVSLLSSAAGQPQSDVTPDFVADADGRTYFQTAEQVTAEDTDGDIDVYVANANGPKLLSAPPKGMPGALAVGLVAILPFTDTQFVLTSARWSANDDDSSADMYRISGGEMTLMSDATASKDPDEPVQFEAVGEDGRVYFSTNERMAPGDKDDARDVYVGDGTQFVAPEPDPDPVPTPPVPTPTTPTPNPTTPTPTPAPAPGPGVSAPPVQPAPGPGSSPRPGGPSTGSGPSSGRGGDTRKPRIIRATMRPSRLAVRRLASLAGARELYLEIRVDEAASVRASVQTGKKRLALSGKAKAGKTLRLRLSKAQGRAWRKLARRGTRTRILITATDAAGNLTRRTIRIRLV